ncbi:MAG: tRNA dimethylallyltransferase [Anaerobutyricum soehngenii]
MDIGTANIRPEEMRRAPHYLVDEFDPSEEFNVVAFAERAKAGHGRRFMLCRIGIPIIVGGTGFCTRALLYDIDFSQHEGKRKIP